MKRPELRMYVLPGGRMPKRKMARAVGYDAHLRALVSRHEDDPEDPDLRKTIFNFKDIPKSPEVARHVRMQMLEGRDKRELVYVMDPGEEVLGGLGFILEMDFPLFYWVATRSNLKPKQGILITDAPTVADPDYRGEPGVLIQNTNSHPFVLHHGIRIPQLIFQEAIIPRFKLVRNRKALSKTKRGAKGFGSTGLL